jgi:hypothetical protein
LYSEFVTSAQFKRDAHISSLPMHGAGKEIGKGLEHLIKKALRLK